ncbi:TATA box-binding protein-associated factor RNA polymerase I subunit C [Channa argus]|uniref:TATA box-binding protein-associated factor RNA polymerase I subunit C n=1 Tax=Channa argus TaxID=215402 RepID=A0A6G1QJ54_CHAAH|nr:TATA box-binding protein-associated factor RNA polymerase I subunit C [Channa argus]
MDYQFPQQLFPSFYKCGPPESVLKHCAGKWGSYDRVRLQGGSGPLSSWTFTSSHQVRGETWCHTEPVTVPLLSPKNAFPWHTPPDPLDFAEHIQNFFVDHCHDAFGCMGDILGENFNFKQGLKDRYRRDSVHMWKVKNFLNMLKFNICQQSYSSRSVDAYSTLLSDIVPSIPTELLGGLLHEELTEQRDRLLFSEAATGGALAFIPFSQSRGSSERGCLLYPGMQGLDRLNFHKVVLQHHQGGSSSLDATSSKPFSLQLKGPVRQISATSLYNDCCVAVRSDYLCGVWRLSEKNVPRLLQVVKTREVATCINVSPHILGEVLVASESGAANLWTVGRGMQKVREEGSNLYFNAKSSWRWCEFSAHPRVILYADRTGAELTDMRVKREVMSAASGHTLFRISNTSECQSGERFIMARYLGDNHPFHHLITTQYSAYVMDERFPCLPMLKWDHMMQSPPMFCHIVPGSAPNALAVGGTRNTKILLGSHSSQEITMLQYSGGRAEACFSQGPPQALLRARDSLKQLPVQLPHRLETATHRLSSPAAGMTCISKKNGGEECICVLQLTEAGDIFYQILKPEQTDTASGLPAAEDEPVPSVGPKKLPQTPDSPLLISDTSSDEGIIGPTQSLTVEGYVGETPERQQQGVAIFSESSEEESESKVRHRNLKQGLQVVVNDDDDDDPEVNQVTRLDTGETDERVCKAAGDSKKQGSVGEAASGHIASKQQVPVKVSEGVLITWKHWLQKLMRKSCEKKPRPHCSKHFMVKTKGLLRLPDSEAKDSIEEDHVLSLRRDLRACMSKRSLLVHSTVSTSLRAPKVVPVPNQVDTDMWRDQLSQRMTLSWEGEKAWRAWWEDQLGLNKKEKVEALKRKRRRQKEARRAAGQRVELSGSFTSSVSYQSELDDFSDSTGWSSATSQGMGSDTEGVGPLSQLKGYLQHGSPRATTPSTVQNDTPDPTLSPTPQKVKPNDQQTPKSPHILLSSQTVKHDSTPASQKRSRRPVDDYLNSLFATQDNPSHHHDFPEEESNMPPLPAASTFQLRSSQSVPVRTLRVDLSQDSSVWSGFSQSLSQSSQGRVGLPQTSQSSQPKKKKSRMGF